MLKEFGRIVNPEKIVFWVPAFISKVAEPDVPVCSSKFIIKFLFVILVFTAPFVISSPI